MLLPRDSLSLFQELTLPAYSLHYFQTRLCPTFADGLQLEQRGPWLTLLLAVDDSTGTAPYALFREREDTRGYLPLLQGIIEGKGIPLSVYTDGHAVFQSRRDFSEVAVGGKPTQWCRALGELGITSISAHSPEAKGRVERANGTFPDRSGCPSYALPEQVPLLRPTRCWWTFFPASISASV